MEASFLDLAAAIDACIIEGGQEGDIKDTYSYILAAIGKVKIFVTEDADVTRVYEYLSRIRDSGFDNIIREIRKIKELYKLLNDSSIPDFPLDTLLGGLFMKDYCDLPIPVSVDHLQSSLPKVLDKFDTLIWIYRSLQEITMISGDLKRYNELPEDWDEDVGTRAKERIYEVAISVGFKPAELFDECAFKTKLIEEEKKWEQREDDHYLSVDINEQLNNLHQKMYEIEHAGEFEYANMEEQFEAEEDTKEFQVACDECGFKFTLDADYNGVVSAYEKEMGAERCHEWSSGECECPNCGNEVSVLYEVWEYPEWCYETDDTTFEGCESAPEPKREKPLKT